ncbi:type II/IV secretion system protein [Roseiconus nitratireducens]|uniref:Type II/IV secretion system protein n=1 Tax=Roseiconus nitratireducens TaxID=2605748 RepID=A0A5M6CXS7_9BACT|nr:ATPase, T2SS/T4P/T4SS family [Roseiconus nitratireducens]KAA5540017.1 type II/IV secretion system protein [Roseiconus nitratireducens]
MNNESTIDFKQLETESGETELSPPEMFAAHLIEWALERHASDLFVSDVDNAVMVSLRRLGKIEPVRKLARAYGHRLQGHLRVLAGADAGETVRPIEGRGVITTPSGSQAQLRLSSVPTLFGQDVALRLFDPARGAMRLDELGIDEEDVQTLQMLLERPSGLILVTGPVVSGKSCTLYAMLAALNDGTRKIHTIEDPIEYSLSGVMQSQINSRLSIDFPDLLSAVLRHSPDVVMIGEVRDQETARTAIRAGASGQLVLATVHSKTAAEGVEMMLQYEDKHKFLSTALIGVISQRLVKRLCPECRQEVSLGQPVAVPDRVAPRLHGAEPKLYRPGGCEVCHGDGFDSLKCIPEIMVVDQAIQDAITNRAETSQLEALAVQNGMLRLPEVALSYVLRGYTTAEEAFRVVNDPELATLAGRIAAAESPADESVN